MGGELVFLKNERQHNLAKSHHYESTNFNESAR